LQEEKLKEAILNYDKKKWKNIGAIVGKSAAGCKAKAKELNLSL